MKQYFQKYLEKFTKFKNFKKFKKRGSSTKKSISLHNRQKDNYKCKRKQLAIKFSSLEKVKKIFEHKTLIASIIIACFLWVIWFIALWPVYTVKFINIIRQDSITNIDLSYNALDDIRGKKMLEIEESNIKDKLLDYQNNINYVDVDINFPNTLEIYIASYPVYFQTKIEEKNYFITQNGTLIPWKENEEFNKIILKNWLQTNIFPDYRKFFEQSDMDAIYNSIQYFEQNIVGSKIVNILYYQKEKEVHFELENQNLIMYTLSKDIKQQIKKTAIFHAEHREITDDSLIYLDMRISNKVFYCDSESWNQCNSNLKKIYPE